jgi:hypothetical protein
MAVMQQATKAALKEWQVAVKALEQGETILLLRKGGIREVNRNFTVERSQVLLYPTYEHQKPELLKPEYANKVQSVESGWHPATIRISAWAEITHTLQVTQVDRVTALQPLHIWSEQFVTERLKWKPNQPLHVLLLKVYQLTEPTMIPYQAAYGGCRSWLELDREISLVGNTVLSEERYCDRVTKIQEILARSF